MNNKRRSNLSGVVDLLNKAIDRLEDISSEESEAFDNLPESFQNSELGESMENVISILDDSVEQLNEAVTSLEEIINM